METQIHFGEEPLVFGEYNSFWVKIRSFGGGESLIFVGFSVVDSGSIPPFWGADSPIWGRFLPISGGYSPTLGDYSPISRLIHQFWGFSTKKIHLQTLISQHFIINSQELILNHNESFMKLQIHSRQISIEKQAFLPIASLVDYFHPQVAFILFISLLKSQKNKDKTGKKPQDSSYRNLHLWDEPAEENSFIIIIITPRFLLCSPLHIFRQNPPFSKLKQPTVHLRWLIWSKTPQFPHIISGEKPPFQQQQ